MTSGEASPTYSLRIKAVVGFVDELLVAHDIAAVVVQHAGDFMDEAGFIRTVDKQ